MKKLLVLAMAIVCVAALGGITSAATLLSPGDFIIAIGTDPPSPDSASSYPGGEAPPLAIDGDGGTKYLNFAGENSGFIVTPAFGSSQVQSFQLTTANDSEGRDPAMWQLFGTDEAIVSADNSHGTAEAWTLVDSGSVALPSDRGTLGPVVSVTNATSFASYKMLFPGLKNPGDPLMQVAEASFFMSTDGSGTDVLEAGDPILAIDADVAYHSSYPGGEAPAKVIDGLTDTKYLNFGKENTGFIVTPAVGSSVVKSFRMTTAGDAPERDPAMWELYGTNDAIASVDNGQGEGESWALIDAGSVALPDDRLTPSSLVVVDNDTSYASYRMVITGLKDGGNANSMQVDEVQFHDVVPEPSSLALILIGLLVSGCRRKR